MTRLTAKIKQETFKTWMDKKVVPSVEEKLNSLLKEAEPALVPNDVLVRESFDTATIAKMRENNLVTSVTSVSLPFYIVNMSYVNFMFKSEFDNSTRNALARRFSNLTTSQPYLKFTIHSTPNAELSKETLADLKKFFDTIKANRTNMWGVIDSHTSVEKLIETMPDIAKYMPEQTSTGTAVMDVELIKNLNKLL